MSTNSLHFVYPAFARNHPKNIRSGSATGVFGGAMIAAAFIGSNASAQTRSLILQNTSAVTYGAARVANHPDLEPQRFTIEFRLRPDGAGFQGSDAFGCHIITKFAEGQGVTYAGAYTIRWSPTTRKINLAIAGAFDGSGATLFSIRTVNIGATARIAATFDGSAAKLYINGVLDSQVSTSFSSVFYAAADLRFGAGNGPTGFARRFQGLIDDVRIWNRALSIEEIAANSSCEVLAPAPGLVGAWTFTGNSFTDLSGLGHHAAPEGNVQFTDQPAAWATPPSFIGSPSATSGCLTGTAGFSIVASGTGPFSYQWRKDGVPIDPSTNPSATTDTLALTSIGPADVASYDCIVTNACGSVTSNPATLTLAVKCSLADIVGTGGGPIVCGDSTIDGSDFIAFINSFSTGDVSVDPLADVAGGGVDGLSPDGIIDGNDFVAFINAFAAGC